jgi:hypothetical protein
MARIETLKPLFLNQVPFRWAILWAVAAVATPTLIRYSVQEFVTGCGTVTYVPFVLLSALFLGWRFAIPVVLGSLYFADSLFMGHDHLLLEGPCDIYGTVAFLIGSGLIIATVEAVRHEIQRMPGPVGKRDRTAGIVFSLENGQAFASWYGSPSAIRLGSQEEVSEMMQDFLAQLELAKRLGSDK